MAHKIATLFFCSALLSGCIESADDSQHEGEEEGEGEGESTEGGSEESGADDSTTAVEESEVLGEVEEEGPGDLWTPEYSWPVDKPSLPPGGAMSGGTSRSLIADPSSPHHE